MDKQAVDFFHGLCQVPGSFCIQYAAEGLVGFGLVYVGVGSTIDDAVNVVCLDKLFHCFQTGDVQQGGFHTFCFYHVGKDKMIGGGLGYESHLTS